jgi:hypothetical protein
MADAATAEISRAKSANGSDIVPSSRTVGSSIRAAARHFFGDELEKLRRSAADGGRYDDAAKSFRKLIEARSSPNS